ncbi:MULTISPECIES: M48 family metalloprotease [unclassified Novosphingobium]|uniref:M48 family metalloprotease n=1 Tax=unclassified Novosphingobium TaxID=2644732 RepID=UPI001356DA92|nr:MULTISPECIES: M48 family metalloprotease [unclassified Novosphingobium]
MKRKKKYASSHSYAKLALIGMLCCPSPTAIAKTQPWPVTLRSQMVRLNEVGYRIGLIAAPLCPSTSAGTGLSLDYIEAYDAGDRDAISQLLGITQSPQVAAVATGSPASTAGVMPGDEIIAIDGSPTSKLLFEAKDKTLFADELEERLAAAPEGSVLMLELTRKGNPLKVRITPQRICSSRFVIKTGIGFNAFSDGTNVAMSGKLIEFSRNDDELALIAAHEIGHVINRDGKAGSLGKRREMEDRADLLGVRLMKCSGYDPESGVQFWLRRDATDMLRLLRAPTHRSGKARVALMREEAKIAACPPTTSFTQGPAPPS